MRSCLGVDWALRSEIDTCLAALTIRHAGGPVTHRRHGRQMTDVWPQAVADVRDIGTVIIDVYAFAYSCFNFFI